MQAPADNQPTAARLTQGPGAILREAREAAGLSREALAQRLRLEPRIVEALESESFERLPGPAFTRGYIRSIARELGFDPAPALDQYAAHSAVEEPVLTDFQSRPPAQITSASVSIKFISVALGVVVLGLVAVWWQRHYDAAPAPATADATGATDPLAGSPEPSIPLPYTYTIVEHGEGPLGSPETWRRQTDGSAPPVIEEVPPVPADAAPAPATGSATEPASAGEPVEEAQAPAEQAPVKGELVLAAARDSWVEITDLNRSRLFFGLVKGGQRIGVSGRPPYDLVIGNAPAVSLSFRGATVDVAAHAINGVARMSVGDLP